jgi:hypothetical protein
MTASHRAHRIALSLCMALAAFGLAACTATQTAPPAPTPTAAAIVPEPGRTIAATPGEVGSLAGYRIIAISGSDDDATARMLDGVTRFAEERQADLEVQTAADPEALDAAFEAAVAAAPDVIVGLGEPVVDLFSFESPQRLEQQFLLIGAQAAEPTANMTAVVWSGATSRGSAASADGALDADSVTDARVNEALAAGIASIRDGVTGVVLSLDTP